MGILVLGIVLVVLKFFNIFAAGNDISNTATLYYQEGGVDKSVQSNTVLTAVITPSPSPSPSPSLSASPSPSSSPPTQTMQILLTLQGRSDNSVSNGTLLIYNAGTSTLVYQKNDVSLPSSGQGEIPVSGLVSGQYYDCKFKVPYFLTSLVPNIQFSVNFGAIFAVQLGGDLDNNNIINSIDFAILSNKWGQSDPISDINKDGTVNTIDFSFLNSNWFKQGS